MRLLRTFLRWLREWREFDDTGWEYDDPEEGES
jgi:hypothetical protein